MTNEQQSALEVNDFCSSVPEKYFAYVNLSNNTITTWQINSPENLTASQLLFWLKASYLAR